MYNYVIHKLPFAVIINITTYMWVWSYIHIYTYYICVTEYITYVYI